MKLNRTVYVLCLCFVFLAANAQEKLKFSQVKIYVAKEQVARLQEAGLDLDHAVYNSNEQSLTTTLDSKEIEKLKLTGVRFKTTIDDEEQDFLRRNDPKDFFRYDHSRNNASNIGRLLFNTPDRSFTNTIVTPAAFNQGSMGGYLTYAEMKKELDSMVLNYPNLVRLDSVGVTHENRIIWQLKISDNASSDENEPEILYTGIHHAREPLGMMNLIFFMQYLLENHATNDRIKEIVNSRELFFLPCLNPDGYVYNQTMNPSGGGLWRKNRQPNSDGSIGQDLNRNYGFGFAYPNSGSSATTTADNYRGDSAFAAKETQFMKQYLRTRNFQYAVNYHSYGGYWIHGYCVPTGSLSSTDSAIIKTTGAMATRNNIYEVGTPLETVGYNANGSSDDWFMGGDAGIRPPVYAISPEVGLGLSTFWPAASTIIGYCKEVFYGNLQAALFAGSYVDVDDNTNIALTSTSGNFNLLVRRIGRVDSSVRVSIIPLQNIATVGAPVTIASLPAYLGTATPSISYTLQSGITNGQRIRFVVRTETGGVTKLDTIVKFFNPTVMLEDNMESGTVGTKWSTSSWNYVSGVAYSGTRSLHESPSGSYANSSTLTINTLNTLDLSNATAAYVSFWVRHRSQPGYDKLQVRVSANGTTYTSLPGIHTIVENKGTLGNIPSLTGYQDYWVREVFDLSSVLGFNAVRLRFEFTSDASVTDQGFYIDDVQVIKSIANLITLPIRFNDIKAIKAEDKVLVRWEASIDANHRLFEVQRSADGVNFSTIYSTTDRSEVYYTSDLTPIMGTNYYRIKAIGEGAPQYSKTVSVVFDQSSLVKLYPNPVKDQLQLELNGITAGRYQLHIITTTGQVVSYKEFDVTNQSRILNVNTNGLNRGNYQLCVRKENGELVEVRSFVKL